MEVPLKPLYSTTPLIYSSNLSKLLPDCDVFLKMESSQPTGSFKMRGLSVGAQKALRRGATKLIGASGGNAGLALSRSARILNVPCTVYCPTSTAPHVIKKFQNDGTEVVLHGSDYYEALERALEESKQPGVAFIDPYDHPDIWEGNSSMVDELVQQISKKPSVIVTSVGGGGLLCGVIRGLEKAGWTEIPLVAMETIGADCFNLSVKANQIVTLDKITSIAKTLGARSVTPKLWEYNGKYKIISETISDAQAVDSCLKFADIEGIIVEPSCGAALSAVFCGVLKKLQQQGKLQLENKGPVVVIVCGGSGETLDTLRKWAEHLAKPSKSNL